VTNRDEKNQESLKTRIGGTLRRFFLNNLWFKVLAVLISIVLWAGLISQDETLTREKVFYGVSVNVSGTDTMKRNGYIVVSDLDEALNDVTVVAAVPQKQYESVDVSTYNIRVELNRITGTGTQELKLLSTTSSNYGRVTSITPSSITLEVEDYVTRYRIPVSVSVTGETPSGWYMSSPSVDPPLVAVSGPQTLVNSISRARVFLNQDEVEWEEGSMVMSANLVLYNRSGEEVVSDLLEVSYESVALDSVVLEASILPTRTYDVTDLIDTLNDVADGYEVVATHISPESITVAARSEVLEQMNELALSDHYVDLKGLTDTTSFQIKVSKPSDDAILSNDTITVTVDVDPIETEETESTNE